MHTVHFVPEGWEDLDRGICPVCGTPVSWNSEAEVWDFDPTLRVLVLEPHEVERLRKLTVPTMVRTQLALQDEIQGYMEAD